MPALDNQRWELFAQYVWQGMTQEEAYEKAGYEPHPANACRLIKNDKIQARLQEFNGRAATQIVLNKSYCLEAVLENVQKALGRIPVRIGNKDEAREVYVYRGDVANRAIQLAGMEIGMFHETKNINIKSDLQRLSNEELLLELSNDARKLIEHQSDEES